MDLGDDFDFSRVYHPQQSSTVSSHVILVTCLCLVLIHYRVPIASRLYSWWQQVWGHLWTLFDLVRWLLPSSYSVGEYEDKDDAITARRRRVLLPDLEEVLLNQENETCISKRQEETSLELEPAFLHPKDYPPGWMVYDKEHGVILKTEADKLEEKRRQEGEKAAPHAIMESKVEKTNAVDKQTPTRQEAQECTLLSNQPTSIVQQDQSTKTKDEKRSLDDACPTRIKASEEQSPPSAIEAT